MADQQVTFTLKGIATDEFATIKESYKDDGIEQIETGYRYEIDPSGPSVGVRFYVVFKCNEVPFIILKVTCAFDVDKESFEALFHEESGNYIIPKGFLTHLTVLTIGTARGILHAKLEKSGFEKFMLPTLNINNLIVEDMTFKKPVKE